MRLIKLYSRRPIVAATLAGAAVLASAAVLVAATSSASAGAATPACSSSELVVWLDTMANGTAGSFYYNLEFTNLSAHACTLTGYPGVSGINLAGAQLGNAASRNAAHGATAITLASATTANMAGVTATVVLRITDVGVYGTSTCGPVTAAGLRVYPPGQTASKVVPYPFRACSHRGPGYLSVEAVQKGIISNG